MKNKKPLQFVKELPPHAELWKIIDETIIHPAEGLSIEQVKHYMYLFLCTASNFKTVKHFLQTEMQPEDLQAIKAKVYKRRELGYPELLPKVKGLPSELIRFLYNHRISALVLPEETFNRLNDICAFFEKEMPDLSALPHSDEIVEVHSRRDLETAVYRALIDETPIPTFKLIVAPTATTDSDGWIPWNGGNCPVEGDVLVEVKFRDGTINEIEEARQWKWNHLGGESDIVAYRIVEKTK